ncbi:Nucleolar protein 9 [Tulasnella sp. 427]|nr:Nucleolar protein 9 [Tulasnella sp. 427]
MPKIDKEKRQRGKKHKKPKVEESAPEEPVAGPSWIAPQAPASAHEPDLPFGPVDPDLKAYLRSVDLKLNEWRDTAWDVQLTEDELQGENQVFPWNLFLDATVTELRGKELVLATDPECSKILERIAHVVNHAAKLGLLEALSGSYPTLVKHCFASHVCQTFLKVATEPLQEQATRSEMPESEEGSSAPSARQLLAGAAKELLPISPSMLSNPFATHVLADLLLILSAQSFADIEAIREQASEWRTSKDIRRKYHRAQQQHKASEAKETTSTSLPEEFPHIVKQFSDKISSEMSADELRRCAFDQVASPSLQALIKVDSTLGKPKRRGQLLESILPGLTSEKTLPAETVSLFESMARDKVASHVVEVIVGHVPEATFRAIWKRCLSPSIGDLLNDPVANFAIATAIGRLNEQEVGDVVKLRDDVWSASVAKGRTGPLKALIDRSASLGVHQDQVVEIVFKAFGLENSTNRTAIIDRVLTLRADDAADEPPAPVDPNATPSMYPNRLRRGRYGPKGAKASGSSEPTVQGALILQSLVRLSDPYNAVVCEGIDSIDLDARMSLCKSPIASRVVDAVVDSPTVSAKAKRRLISSFIGHYHVLADDKIGSRVAENLYKAGDPFLRSTYGRFLLNHVNIPLLKRSPEEWKRAQAQSVTDSISAPGKRKRDKDEIDEVFQSSKRR